MKKNSKTKKTYPELRIGSYGDLVTMMQDILSKNGSAVKVDGTFNIGTKSALKSFQKKHGITPDGVCGSQTWDALLDSLNYMPEPAGKPEGEKKPVSKLTNEEKIEIMWEYFCKEHNMVKE